MRQGNQFDQWVGRSEYDEAILRLPLELEMDWDKATSVTWTDNGDGTYTLTPHYDRT